jgi:hypothetical protein
MVAEINIGFEAGDALARNPRALQTSDQFLALARKHRTRDDFEDAGKIGGCHICLS